MWYPFTAHERNTSVPETKEDDGFLKKSVKKKKSQGSRAFKMQLIFFRQWNLEG